MPENHQVVGKDAQTNLSGLAVMISRTKSAAKVAFEHAENRFDLPTLTI